MCYQQSRVSAEDSGPSWSAEQAEACGPFGARVPTPHSFAALLAPAVESSAPHTPFNQWRIKMDLVQSAIARPKSIGYF